MWPGNKGRWWYWIRPQVYQAGIQSFWVCGLILLMIGMVIAFQSAYQLKSIGTEILIPDLLAVSMTRELAPMMTAWVIAGRAGASMTAEIGTMKVTEQIDAIQSMSIDPIRHLFMPRLLALAAITPLLTILSDILGIFGGFIVCVYRLQISPQVYIDRVFDALTFSDIYMGLVKSFIFGILIAVVSCREGLEVKGGAQGVGLSTMKAVVLSFILIVVA
ncbi:MAG: ABC transporter permease, partial [Candidatus Omnitrophica bacterium]|nr:ABC transporter permease [Candidatus Omnitrophota bacterium]